MTPAFKNFLINWIPPALLRFLTGFFYGWNGNYPSWNDAVKKSKGYDSPTILEKVKQAALKVKQGEAAFERDSVVFYQPDYAFPLLASLLTTAIEKQRLHVLDFGGSLGSLYFQHKIFFERLPSLQWHVVEQPHFAGIGKKLFSDSHLSFHLSINECLNHHTIDTALFGSSLQYLENPFSVLDEITQSNIPYLLIDRTPLLQTRPTRITIQKVQPSVYNASYPCRLINRTELLDYLLKHFELISRWQHQDRINISDAAFCGFFLKRK